ncbi:MAG: penicillin acylase family protein [Cyclobacteriaceae bacterium]|nr:penicillin acylase family protein [Cyclobacteriaceae bacterium]
MKILKWIAIVGVAVVLVLAAVIYFFLRSTAPDYDGTLKLAGPSADINVIYDQAGVPHIYATNETDAYFALGYVHAQDRLFQMEMLRRAAGGRLSEVLGPDMIKVDKMFRTLGINRFAEEQAAKYLSADTAAFQRAALAYQKGINAYVANGKTPLEFTVLGIPKEPFTPKDLYLAVGFMSFGFAEGLRVDPVVEKIRQELGAPYLRDLAVATPPDAALIPVHDGKPLPQTPDSLIVAIHDALEQLPVPLWQGSNGWVIAGNRSSTGFPILANDTHIGFQQPAVWYEAHLEYPGQRFYGHHLAGIPFGLLGNNEFCAYGLTMFENDDTDFFVEERNPANPGQVKSGDTWYDLRKREEIIKVKGQADVVLEVNVSRHGPIINGVLEQIADNDKPTALWWLMLHEDNQALQAAYRLNHARTFEEVQSAAALFSAPGLNLMYGDRDKNIAWWAVAKLPIRPPHVVSKFFLDGASGRDEYLGFYDFSKNPHAINPPAGFVYSANNQPDTVDGVLYPGYYYPIGRAGRVANLLSEAKSWTPEEAMNMQLDAVSIMHPPVAREMAAVLKASGQSDIEPLITALEKWDGGHEADDTSPSVYYNMLSQVLFLSMADEIGVPALKSLLGSSVAKNSFLTLLSHDDSPWWDDVRTKEKKETRADIILHAAQETLRLLKQTSGTDPAGWQWKKIHTLTHGHPMGRVKPLDKLFNVGPYEVAGGMEVINNLSFSLDTTGYFPVTVGPALRKVTDFSNMENGFTVSPSGQSGNVMSPYYQNQAGSFATGKVRPMLMNKAAIESAQSHRLTLQPE